MQAGSRSVPILPETNGRVAEIYVGGVSSAVKQGAPIIRLDSSTQEAAVEAARRKIAEVDAALVGAKTDVTLTGRSRRPVALISRRSTNYRPSRS